VEDLERHLAEAAAAAGVPALRTLLTESGIDNALAAVRRDAAGPLAHLICRAAIRDESGSFVDAVVAGLADQRQLLALTDAIDELLASDSFKRSHERHYRTACWPAIGQRGKHGRCSPPRSWRVRCASR